MAHLKIKEEDDLSGGKKKVGWTLFLFFFVPRFGLVWCESIVHGWDG